MSAGRAGAVLPSSNKGRWAAVALTGAGAALLCAGVVFSLLNGDRQWASTMVLIAASNLAVGATVAFRRPEHPVGWLLATFGTLLAGSLFLVTYAAYGLVTSPGAVPAPYLASWIAGFAWLGEFSLLLFFLPLLFPTGRLPAPVWRPVAVAGAAYFVAAMAVTAAIMPVVVQEAELVLPSPLPVEVAPSILAQVESGVLLGLVLSFVAALASLVVRYRGAQRVERQQIRWLLFTMVAMVTMMLSSWGLDEVGAHPLLASILDVAIPIAILGVPLSIGIAILRYRLFQIDLIIKRTLLYACVSATLVAMYLLGVLVFQSVLRAMTGQESQLAVVASTLLVAAASMPLRSRIQRALDRVFYRAQYDAAATLAAFGAAARAQIELGALTRELAGTVEDALKPTHVSVWLRRPRPDQPPR